LSVEKGKAKRNLLTWNIEPTDGSGNYLKRELEPIPESVGRRRSMDNVDGARGIRLLRPLECQLCRLCGDGARPLCGVEGVAKLSETLRCEGRTSAVANRATPGRDLASHKAAHGAIV
jgi:hypothetical protein